MKHQQYGWEYALLAIVILVSIAGFWDIYVGADADPTPYHHLHVVTNFLWLALLLYQLSLIGSHKYRAHRTAGLAVLVMGPLLVATTALLTVHSAHKGVVSGQGDFLIVQNVMGTLELGLLILLAFILRKQRTLHGSFLLSTAILFLGIALFFTLISFVPAFRIEGPETFHRFATAGRAGQAVCLTVGVLFFLKDWRHGWPFLLAGSSFLLNDLIGSFLAGRNLIQPLTELVGSLSPALTFVGTFAVLCTLLAATGIRGARPRPGM
ncbi:MAG: hypothetical protein ABR551_03510 [Gemmatimonadales bacterium]